MIKIISTMSILTFLFGCSKSLKESEFYGYALPIKPLEQLSTYYLGQITTSDGTAEYLVRDGNNNRDLLSQDGVAAIDLKSKNIIWQTPFTTKVNVAATDTIMSYCNLVEGITCNDGLVFCVFRQVATLKKQNGTEATQTSYKYLYLEAQSGKVLKEDSMDLAGKQLLFIDNKLICKNQQTNQTMRLDPNTGTMLWSYNDLYATRNNRSNANDRTISFYRTMSEADWQIVVLDFATGLPLFEKTLTNIPKHKIDQVLCQDGRVYVDMGAVYYENPLGAIKEHYKVYRVVFDQKSQEALWRSEIFEEKR